MSKDPAILFYTGDFLNGCTDLTLEERGQYITLLCLQHQKGHLSEKTIRLSVGSINGDVIKKFTKDENGYFYNIRMEEEIAKRQHFLDTRYFNGKKGGRPSKPNSKPNSKPTHNLPEDENENEIIDIIKVYKGTTFAKIEKLTELRKKHLQARIKEHGIEKVKEMISIADKSDFLHGKNNNGWKANFDWLINPNNFIKVIEGNYVNKQHKEMMP